MKLNKQQRIVSIIAIIIIISTIYFVADKSIIKITKISFYKSNCCDSGCEITAKEVTFKATEELNGAACFTYFLNEEETIMDNEKCFVEAQNEESETIGTQCTVNPYQITQGENKEKLRAKLKVGTKYNAVICCSKELEAGQYEKGNLPLDINSIICGKEFKITPSC